MSPTLQIDGTAVTAAADTTVLAAARGAGIYIPSLCDHPDLPPPQSLTGAEFVFCGDDRIESDDPRGTWDGCGLCAVAVNGEIVRACATTVAGGMTVLTDSPEVIAHRRRRLGDLLADHPHACLTCAQADGCPRTQCSADVPEEERCCELLGACELERVARFVGVPPELPRYRHGGRPRLTGQALFDCDHELCVGCLRCVRACQDLRRIGALSFVLEGGRPRVGTTGTTLAESHCRFCGACVEVCPTGALMDAEPAVRRAAGEERDRALVPCRAECPAGIDVPRLLRHVVAQEPVEAAAVIREKVPLVRAVSYACFHPCEDACRRSELNEPVSICRIKRFAVDADRSERPPHPSAAQPTGRNVAVVGSGPAGLTAAYFLARKGHRVTVHEALPEAGGMMRVGIPEYRFPRPQLEADLDEVRSAGVAIVCDAPVDAATLERLAAENDAVFVATGAHEARHLELPGGDLAAVHLGVDFLRQRALGRLRDDLFGDQRVLVVGGGDVAVDAARVARRLGARQVTVVSLEQRADLPACDREIGEAEEEGIDFEPGWGPKAITGDGAVSGLLCRRCTGVLDEDGAFNPTYDDETCTLPADAVILAIGQAPSSRPFAPCGIGISPAGTIELDPQTLETGKPRVFAGGDVATGPRNLIDAIAMGRKAAAAIDRTLGGDGDLAAPARAEREPRLAVVEGFAAAGRHHPIAVPGPERVTSFRAVEETFSAAVAGAEAARCLQCDLRLLLRSPELPPRAEATLAMSRQAVESVPEAEGVLQLLDEHGDVIAIEGVMNLKAALGQALEQNERAARFCYERDPMFTKRESELIQQYLQEHGELPGGGDSELDDLF